MKTNVSIEASLVKKVTKLYRSKTKNSAVEKALRDQIRVRQQLLALIEMGKITLDENYNYKAMRSR